jgi:osmoprotectant transport system ATP-binding protein
MIEFDSVTKRYDDGTIGVGPLSLTAPSGKITVFVGPSGCGKTTSLRMINRMTVPTTGTIRIDGNDTATVNTTDLRRGIGYVIQQGGLFPNKTVLENVITVPRLLGQNIAHARTHAKDLLERVGLDPALASRYPAQLSGGQQQRVGVARALAADPPVMLMDEPFSAVDPVVREQLQNEFLRLQAELGKTIVFVTHDIDEAVKLGDRIAVLQPGGSLAQFDEPEMLLSHPADTFVAEFVGRDRGYRALGFTHVDSLPVHAEPTVTLGQSIRAARENATDRWVLVVSDDHHPLGWLALRTSTDLDDNPVTTDLLNLGGTLAARRGSLREALDASLSSPSGRGVLIHGDGTFAGTITASEVLTRIEVEATPARVRAGDLPDTATAGRP